MVELSRAEVVRLWTVEDLSDFLAVPVKTLYQWRTKGYGPPGMRIGRYVRYRREEVMTWVAQRETVAS